MEQRVPNALRNELRGMLIQPDQTMAIVAPNLSKGALIATGTQVRNLWAVRVKMQQPFKCE